MTDDEAKTRLAEIHARMDEACEIAKRASGSAQLVAVSKTFDADAIRPFLKAGQRVFGENRVQEAAGKWPQLRKEFSDIELHLIGPLQTNKVGEAVELFDVIQTLDRDKLAAELAKELKRIAPEAGRMAQSKMAPKLYVQVNTGEEEQKAGVAPREAVDFVRRCREVHALNIDGLMCIPPAHQAAGPHFALLNGLAQQAGVVGLSMGMSADYEEGIWLGATHIRVGSALFGERYK